MTFEAGIFKLSEELNTAAVNPLGLLADDEELKKNFSATEISFQMPKRSYSSDGKSQPQPQRKAAKNGTDPSDSDTEETTDVSEEKREVRKLKVTFFERGSSSVENDEAETDESPSSDLETTTTAHIATGTKYAENKDQIFELLKLFENFPKSKKDKISKAHRWRILTYSEEVGPWTHIPCDRILIHEFQWCNGPQGEELKCSHPKSHCGSFEILCTELAKLKGLKVPEIHYFPEYC
eukprot:GHVP01017157.1.p1 GENE.GHVP01017157.1~~GHVP01017157.1.p1  ORF type:complete len:247 (-),score=40.08 GHVP01017157.1:1190-1900(-)